MTTRSIGPWPPTPLDLVRAQSSADALADIPRDLSAGSAALFGHLVGGDLIGPALENTPNPAPVMPGQSTRGHDHSGGIAGRPFGRTIWGMHADHDYDGNFTNNARTHFFQLNAVFDAFEANTYYIQTHSVPVPGCDPGPNGAYTLLGVMLRLRVAGPFQNIAIQETWVRIANRHPDIDAVYDFPFFGGLAGEQNLLSDGITVPNISVVPGVINPISIGFYVVNTSGGGSVIKQSAFEIEGCEFGVFEVPS